MLTPATSYDALAADFRWNIPPRLNLAVQVCDAWAEREPERLALIDLTGGQRVEVSYGGLRRMADGLAWYLAGQGVGPGDRVGVLRPQGGWTAAAHIAIWKLGAISIPLFTLFGPDALITRLSDAGVRLVISDPTGTDALRAWLATGGTHIVP